MLLCTFKCFISISAPPLIFPINDVTVTEGVLSIMKACHVQADPYPYIAWKNISNGELLNDSSLGVQVV